jgi:hypothetical protein
MRILVAAILIFTVGCTTARKAVAYMDKHPEVASAYCAKTFPVRDSLGETIYDTVYVDNQDWTNYLDSATAYMDSLVAKADSDRFLALKSHEECLEVVGSQEAEIKRLAAAVRGVKVVYVPCKPDTVKITQTVYRENTAQVEYLKGQLAVSNANLEESLKDESKWRLWCLITWGIIGLYVFAKLKFKLPF